MNIAFVVYSHYSRDARVRRYAESLAKKGFGIDVVCLTEEYRPKEANISLIKYPLGRKRLGKYWYILEYTLFFFYSLFILATRSLFKKYKLVHVNNMPDFLVFTAAVPKLLGAKIILDLHDPMPELYMSKYHVCEDSWMVKFLKWLEKISINYADYTITANPIFKEIFLSRNKMVKGKIEVILNCPDEKIFRPVKLNKIRRYFTLLYMGTVEERFGLDITIEALSDLVKRIPNIRFIIIPKLEDEGRYFRNLKNKIKELGLKKYILFKSPTPLENLIDEIRQADIGIVLAKDGIFTESIIPVKLLEFIKMGIPIIATETRALRRYFLAGQICFLKKNNPSEFSAAVLKLYENLRLRKIFAQRAKDYLKKNNWQNEKKKYFAIFHKLGLL